jgi:hypothetical protein
MMCSGNESSNLNQSCAKDAKTQLMLAQCLRADTMKVVSSPPAMKRLILGRVVLLIAALGVVRSITPGQFDTPLTRIRSAAMRMEQDAHRERQGVG